MPNYIFANKEQRGTSSVEYSVEQRGDKWWYERVVRITYPNATDEVHSQWFGGYDSEASCLERVDKAKNLDTEFAEL